MQPGVTSRGETSRKLWKVAERTRREVDEAKASGIEICMVYPVLLLNQIGIQTRNANSLM
jgi:hypothetical protein